MFPQERRRRTSNSPRDPWKQHAHIVIFYFTYSHQSIYPFIHSRFCFLICRTSTKVPKQKEIWHEKRGELEEASVFLSSDFQHPLLSVVNHAIVYKWSRRKKEVCMIYISHCQTEIGATLLVSSGKHTRIVGLHTSIMLTLTTFLSKKAVL